MGLDAIPECDGRQEAHRETDGFAITISRSASKVMLTRDKHNIT